MIASVAANAGWNSTQTLIEKKLHSNLYNCKFKKACVSERRPSDEKNTSVWCSKESFVKTCIHFEKCVHLLQKSCFQKMLWDKWSCVSNTGKSKLALWMQMFERFEAKMQTFGSSCDIASSYKTSLVMLKSSQCKIANFPLVLTSSLWTWQWQLAAFWSTSFSSRTKEMLQQLLPKESLFASAPSWTNIESI